MQNPKEFLIFSEKLKGKEQLIRLVQYLAFLVLALTNKTKYINLTRKAQKLSGNLSMVRKVLRFGMPISNILNIINLFSLSGFKKKLFSLLNNFLGLVFYFSDHLLYFYRIRLIKLEKGSKKLQTIDVIRNLAWLLRLITKVIQYTMDIHKVQKKIQKLSVSNSINHRIGEAREQFLNLLHQSDLLVLGIIKNCMDVPVALYFLDPSKVSPILVGALGSMSSVLQSFKIIITQRYAL